ncbi:M14 family metallopeptidase [Paremcibacter congregatus]|nr:M14 family metallopeptidase [Paremcibacter congregatus]
MLQKVIRKYLFALVCVAALIIPGAHAQETTESGEVYPLWPGTQYDPAIPTHQQVLGYAPGEKISSHSDMLRYMEALTQAAPDRMQLHEYARSWEDRKLIYVVIANPENLKNLPALERDMQGLSDPRKTDISKADALIKSLPATVWLGYGVHGDEISSTDAAMMTAYHLLAARNSPEVDQILANVVTFIDPMQNPDGRTRFINHYETSRGLLPDSSRLSVEQNQAWPGGRANHYMFDMNRDWFAMTQPETIGRVEQMQRYLPLVVVDLHEMSGNQSYYFAPPAMPLNPHLAPSQGKSMELIGRNNAKWFDTFGFDYFTREVFDAFYPGYGDGWPTYYGGVSMTYEQGSSRGLVFHREDGTDLHYRDTVRHHFVASLSTAEAAAQNRQELLQDFYNYRKSAIREGQTEKVRSYILPGRRDKAATTKLAGLLTRQGVEVLQADKSFKVCGASYPSDSYIINTAQPAKRLIRTLMDEDVSMNPDFLKEQERRRTKDYPAEIYDVTAWSLPLMYNVESIVCDKTVKENFPRATAALFTPATLSDDKATVAYLAPWGQATSARLLTHALRQGLTVKSNDKAFTAQGKRYPAGSLIFEVLHNPEDLPRRLNSIAQLTGAEIHGVNSSWVTDGPNFGSDNVTRMIAPKVAIVWDEPTSPYSAGNTRFVIERQFDYPVTNIRTEQLRSGDLSRYQVLILPTSWGSYQDSLGKGGAENLKAWVKRGGTLIAMGTALRYVSDPDVGLLSTHRENNYQADEIDDVSPAENGRIKGTLLTSAQDLHQATTPAQESPDYVPGVLVKAKTDGDHWLAAGLAPSLNILVGGSDIYSPLRRDAGHNVVYFQGPDDLLASGYLWEENRRQLAYKPFLMVEAQGRGHVIGFTQDPTTRAYLDGLNISLINAIFRGASHSQPLR